MPICLLTDYITTNNYVAESKYDWVPRFEDNGEGDEDDKVTDADDLLI